MSEHKSTTNPHTFASMKQKSLTRKIAITAIFTAMSVVLMYLEIPLPFMPPFLKFDFSEVPVMIVTFALSPVYGLIVELLKNLIHLTSSQTQGIGELSNLLTGCIFVLSSGIVYRNHRSRKGAIISMLVGTLSLAVFACPLNYFLTLPLYSSVLHFSTEAIVGMSHAVNSLINTKLDLIIWGFIPFNLFKGFFVSFVTFWIYKPISRLIHTTHNKVYEPTEKSSNN